MDKKFTSRNFGNYLLLINRGYIFYLLPDDGCIASLLSVLCFNRYQTMYEYNVQTMFEFGDTNWSQMLRLYINICK